MVPIKNVKTITPERKTDTVHLSSMCCVLLLMLYFFTAQAGANTVAEIGSVNTPHGVVILIVDGLSSYYTYPEYTPCAIDGSVLKKADVPKMQEMFNNSCRILDVTVPQTFTEGGHSVIATGYSRADSELTGSSGTTIFDIAHDYNYLTFAIMEKGDSYGFCNKQNVVMHDTENSINEPEMVIETNMLTENTKTISFEITDQMQSHSSKLQEKLDQYPEGSIERYNEYNNWIIETGIDIIEYMEKEYPEQNYILTINAGAVDSAGHYKKNSGYVACIEGLDNASYSLYETCLENNLAFVLTGDHGMAFPTDDSKGGHQAEKYSVMTESQKVPLVIAANDIENVVVDKEVGQEDIAPTILEVLNIPGKLRLADGKAITLKEYTNVEVIIPEEGELVLSKNDEILFRDDVRENIAFQGLEPDNEYKLVFKPFSDPDNTVQQFFNAGSDISLKLLTSEQRSKSDKSYQNSRYIVGGILIGAVNLTGLLLIRKVLKE
ncbi:sulfatase-like hydrolase/transferase [Methanolobus sediminis]|uniref:Sulfatase-like hydrolase/transferase n=1 Tax=Methanolobus sediminis TaxID=3072978 RepID=A0AA51YLM2_9EURY|nr:sulfatase-like hydrolase/transferase [Methanolobus sediminis]WMW25124.1 sulfatase-like hydrolase/transferase [Methanolobus sediminis]